MNLYVPTNAGNMPTKSYLAREQVKPKTAIRWVPYSVTSGLSRSTEKSSFRLNRRATASYTQLAFCSSPEDDLVLGIILVKLNIRLPPRGGHPAGVRGVGEVGRPLVR
jgi:hypothetical protein